MNQQPTPVNSAGGCGCNKLFKLGCGGIVILVAVFFAIGLHEQKKEEKAEQAEHQARAEFKETMNDFAQHRAPELLVSIRQLDDLEADLRDRCGKLRQLLVNMGKNPEDDDDYKRWTGRLGEIDKARADLRKDLEAAYLAYQKFMLSPDDTALGQNLDRALEAGRSAGAAVTERYRLLREEISE